MTTNRPTVSRRPLVVVAAIAIGQAVALAIGFAVVYARTHGSVVGNVESFVLARNAEVARTLTSVIGDLPADYDPDDERWRRAQQAVEELRLPSGGFACITDASGRIACHPDIADEPRLRRVNVGAETFVDIAPTADLALPADVRTGVIDFGVDGLHYVAAAEAGGAGSRIYVHQPAGGLARATALLTGDLLLTIIGTGVVVTVLTAAGGYVLARRTTGTMVRTQEDLEEAVSRRTRQLRRSREAVMTALAQLAEHRDNETGEHVDRISRYAVVLSDALRDRHAEIDDEWIDRIRVASRLHDIGKVAVPDAVLLKPGKLDEAEFEQIKRHTTVAADTLLSVHRDLESDPMLAMAVEIALYHHEKWDGSGYPMGVAGDAIPLSARIVAVIDVFDALRSPRVYKPGLPLERVRTIIEDSAGGHFDPTIVEVFLARLDEIDAIYVAHAEPAPAAGG